jgi:hypothetical protein
MVIFVLAMRPASRRLPAKGPIAMAIPPQTIKILGALVGNDHPFDRDAQSSYTKADGGHHPPFAQTNGADALPTVFFVTTSFHCRLNV